MGLIKERGEPRTVRQYQIRNGQLDGPDRYGRKGLKAMKLQLRSMKKLLLVLTFLAVTIVTLFNNQTLWSQKPSDKPIDPGIPAERYDSAFPERSFRRLISAMHPLGFILARRVSCVWTKIHYSLHMIILVRATQVRKLPFSVRRTMGNLG